MKTIDHYWSSINPVSILLLPVTAIFCSLSYLRRSLYYLNIFKRYRSPVPVIVVGNISVGGTGKTPLIIELVRQLQHKGYTPAVISRGYGGESEEWPLRVGPATSAGLCGDEPALIFMKTGCPVVVGPDRRQDIECLLKDTQCDIILSDDGMQHYALQRNGEIAVVDAQRMFGNRLCLPSGPLREPVSRLKQVDLVLYNGLDNDCGFVMQAQALQPVSDLHASQTELSKFKGQTVHAIAGIGNPNRFFGMLEASGLNVIPHAYADHHKYSEKDVLFDDDLAVLMTDKDAVKCREFSLHNTWSVGVDVQLTEQAQVQINRLFDSLLK